MISDLSVPFLKWAGGKRQLLRQMEPFFPEQYGAYYEPFLGGGAVLFHLNPDRAFVSDRNRELINAYQVIKRTPLELIRHLKTHRNTREYFYRLRALDREPERFAALTDVERASRLICLNRLCYNGLFRVNSRGEFNVPFGNYANPRIVAEELILSASAFLNRGVELACLDFEEAADRARPGDFIYFDPPYEPVSESASFTAYSAGGFGRECQIRLRDLFRRLDKRGCRLMLSNSATASMRALYGGFNIRTLNANRCINCAGKRRGSVAELLVTNY